MRFGRLRTTFSICRMSRATCLPRQVIVVLWCCNPSRPHLIIVLNQCDSAKSQLRSGLKRGQIWRVSCRSDDDGGGRVRRGVDTDRSAGARGSLADFVAKVGKEQLGSKNAQQSNLGEWILNQHCAQAGRGGAEEAR